MNDTPPSLTCPNCSHDNLDDAKFCQNCGQPLSRICSNCNTSNEMEATFCRKCGTKLVGIQAEREKLILSELQLSAPQGLREKIRSSSSELEGQRKPVTILFADIVGSTSIAEKLDPEVWKEIVSGAHRRVGEAIYRYEGTIAQLLGDGVLAFFGAPITHEDDPIRAMRAALDIQDSIKAYEQELEDLIESFQMRIGINTGEVVIGNIGTDMHMEYLAIGDAVNVAARLQSAADAGAIWLSESCTRMVSSEFELQNLGEIKVKGKAEPLQAFELVGMKAVPENGRGIEGFPTPYVGREREVEELQSALLALCAGHGQIVTVMGEAGIGKTRLLEEVKSITSEDKFDRKAAQISPSSIRWLEGSALSYGGSLSYWMITQLLLDDLGLSDGAPQVEIKVALRRRVRTLFGEEKMHEVLPYLAHLLSLKGEAEVEEHVQSLDGETLKAQTLKSVSDYFGQVADEGPIVLVLEDMHWMDPSSLEALEGLLPLTDRVPLMILMLMRIERDHGSWGIRIRAESDFPHRYKEFHLQRLSESDSSYLLEKLLRDTKLPEANWHTIMDRSEGNPFYLEEVVRHLIEQDLILPDEQGWRMAEELKVVGIPDSLQGVLLARIDRLEDEVRRTLQMASVIGKSFLYRILETIAEAELQLDAHLSQLQRVDLIREKARLPELEYIFKHTMTQEAAYNSLLHERRKKFHLKVGEALEELFHDRAEEFSGLMAYHFEAAEALQKAVDYLQQAGDQARLAYAHKEALEFYNRALAILKEQEEYDRAAQTLMKIGLTYHTAFDFGQSRQAYDEAFAMRKRDWATRPKTLKPAPHPMRRVIGEPLTLDPSKAVDAPSYWYIRRLFSGLVDVGPGLEIIPEVAKSWEISEDGRRYVFHLRDDVFWSDGNQVIAMDFMQSWIRSLDPAIGAPKEKLGLFYDIKNARAYHEGRISEPEQLGIRAIDELTLEVELERTTSYFLNMLMLGAYPVPSHVVESYGDAWTDPEHIVSNGPFRMESYNHGESICLVRNSTYHRAFSGNLEKIEVRFYDNFSSDDEVIELYEKNGVDIASLSPSMFHKRHKFTGEYITLPLPTGVYAGFDSSCSPFNDLNVRRALVMAADREMLSDKILDGFSNPATGGLVPPNIPGHSPEISLPYDPHQARQHLKQAGYPDGKGFPEIEIVTYPDLRETVNYLTSQWLENLNVNVSSRFVEYVRFIDEVHDQTLFLFGWTADYHDPDNFLRVCVQGYIPSWQNDQYKQLLDTAMKTLDQKDRISLYQKADKLLMEEAVLIPITYEKTHLLCKPWVRLSHRTTGFWYDQDVIIEPH